MPCPHNEITIVQRSKRQSAVASAAYQSGERLFSEYDQKQKYYSHKSEIVHTEIMLPPHAPPEYADRNTLWNAAEAVEKQWNSQLARRFVLAIPRELPRSQYADLIRDYCREFFVSKGMIADYAIHDPHPPGHNPHAHVLLTMRAMDEHGKWLPKSRKVYDLDENGERIKLPSGRWKSHKEDTVDWNDQKYAEIWRQGWADTANRYLEAIGSPERLDLRSYARQGIDKIPTVHMGPAVSRLEKKGIQTNIGNLNRDIKAANSLMQSIRQMVRSLKGWLSGLKEKKAALLEALEQAKEPTIPELLSRYLDMRSEERTGWTSKGQLKGTVNDFNKVMDAIRYLQEKELSTVESLDAYLDTVSEQAVFIRAEMKPKEKRMKEIDTLLSHIANFEAHKSVHAEYAAIRFKKPKEQFAAAHRDELDAYNAALRYFKVHLDGAKYSTKKLNEERTQLTQDELKDFINRQLVFTRQSTKAVAQLLKEMLPDTEIVYAKAGNANDFKSENNIIKIRELNDLHHAKDAYINIVVGNVYNTKFNHSARFYFNERESNDYDLKNLYRRDIPGAWKVADKERIIQIVEKNTAKAIRMTLGGQGRLFDVNPVKAGQNDDLLPLKMKGAISDTSKYGGYNSQKTAYFMLVRSKGKKGKIMLSMEAFPLWMEKQNKAGIEEKVRFCAKQGLVEPEIVIDRIKLNTLLYMDGSYAWLRGKTGNRIKLCNANQLYLNKEEMKILKSVSNYMSDRKFLKRQDLPVGEKIKAEDNVRLYDALVEKLGSPVYRGLSIRKQAEFLKKSRERFISLSLEKQCVVIFEVLHLMQCNSVNSDLTLLGGVPNAGSLVNSKFVQDNEMKIIYQSCTGYYREIIDFEKFL